MNDWQYAVDGHLEFRRIGSVYQYRPDREARVEMVVSFHRYVLGIEAPPALVAAANDDDYEPTWVSIRDLELQQRAEEAFRNVN